MDFISDEPQGARSHLGYALSHLGLHIHRLGDMRTYLPTGLWHEWTEHRGGPGG